MNIVLVEPEIPQNTGNIARTCAATGTKLHLIHPMGFSVDEKQVKRAGLDYWPLVELTEYENWAAFLRIHGDGSFFYATTKAPHVYTEVTFPPDAYLVFGKETKGLPEDLLQENLDRCIRIPMRPTLRSLNLANSVAIVLYEALRQQGFPALEETSARFV